MDNILFITYSFAGTGANMLRYKSLSSYLVEQGFKVDVIGYYDSSDHYEEGINYYKLERGANLLSLLWFIRLFIGNLFMLRIMSVKRYIKRIGLASVTLVSALRLIRKNDYKSCLVSVAPWAYYIIIKHLRKSVRVFLDICDPLYKNALISPHGESVNFYIEKRALEAADVIATVNEPTIGLMTKEMGIARDKVFFITPAMNDTEYRPSSPSWCSFSHPLRMIYCGSLYAGYRDLSEVLPAVVDCGGVSLDIYSNSVCRPENKDGIVSVHDVVPHNSVMHLYQEFDVLLFIDNFYGYQIPSKIYEMLAQNKPILFVYDSRNTYLFERLKGQEGLIFVENKRDQIKNALQTLIQNKKILVNYNVDLSSFSEKVVNQRLLSCLISHC